MQARKEDQEEISELRRRYDALLQSSQAKEREHLRIIKALEASHCQAAEQLEGLYEKKIAHDADKYNDLQSDRWRPPTAKLRSSSRVSMRRRSRMTPTNTTTSNRTAGGSKTRSSKCAGT